MEEVTREAQEWMMEGADFARKLADRFYKERPNLGIDREDYVGAAFLGLCDAAHRFDPDKGISFQSFSFLRIRGSLYDLLRKGGVINRAQFQKYQRALKASESSGEECAAQARVLFHSSALFEELGIEVHDTDGGERQLSYAFEHDPEHLSLVKNLRSYLIGLIERLPEREKLILLRKYFADETFEEMSSVFRGMSKSWLSRLHTRAIEQLRQVVIEEMEKNREFCWHEA